MTQRGLATPRATVWRSSPDLRLGGAGRRDALQCVICNGAHYPPLVSFMFIEAVLLAELFDGQ
jgi:hypothetical protein